MVGVVARAAGAGGSAVCDGLSTDWADGPPVEPPDPPDPEVPVGSEVAGSVADAVAVEVSGGSVAVTVVVGSGTVEVAEGEGLPVVVGRREGVGSTGPACAVVSPPAPRSCTTGSSTAAPTTADSSATAPPRAGGPECLPMVGSLPTRLVHDTPGGHSG